MKTAQNLTEQFGGFRLLTAELDALSGGRLDRQVRYARRLREAPVESVSDAGRFEVGVCHALRASVAQRLPNVGRSARLSVFQKYVGSGVEKRQIVRSADAGEAICRSGDRFLAMLAQNIDQVGGDHIVIAGNRAGQDLVRVSRHLP